MNLMGIYLVTHSFIRLGFDQCLMFEALSMITVDSKAYFYQRSIMHEFSPSISQFSGVLHII
jgi:hypothetical protein